MAGAATAGGPAVDEALFRSVCFHLSDALDPDIRAALHDLLVSLGASACPPNPAYDPDSPPPHPRPPRFDPARLTHFVTDSLDFPEYDHLAPRIAPHADATDPSGGESEAGDPSIFVVTPAWVTRSYDLQTLQPPRFYSADRALIFSGTVICTSELPESDTRDIHAGVLALGGQVRRELTREVTHLICAAEHGAKYEMAIKHGTELGIVVVLPHWFEESLKLAALVPIDIYRFPSPPFTTSLRTGSLSAPTRPFAERLHAYWRAHLSSSSSSSDPPAAQPNTSTHVILHANAAAAQRALARTTYLRSTSATEPLDPVSVAGGRARAFEGKKVYLASDLALTPGLERALKDRVRALGGECWAFGGGARGEEGGEGEGGEAEVGRARRSSTAEREDAWAKRRKAERRLRESDIVIVRSREGWEYWTAFDLNVSIGNLAYLYHCLATSTLPSPLSHLMHYPLPTLDGLPEFALARDRGEEVVVTISNYAGPARDYVRAMVEVLGAKFEGTMSRNTSYVVSASEFGAKVMHARQWHIPLVTHLWLEALVLEWRLLPPSSHPAYVLSPSTSAPTNFMTLVGDSGYTLEGLRRWAARDENREAHRRATRPVDELEADEWARERARERRGESERAREMEEAKRAEGEARERARAARGEEEEEEEEEGRARDGGRRASVVADSRPPEARPARMLLDDHDDDDEDEGLPSPARVHARAPKAKEKTPAPVEQPASKDKDKGKSTAAVSKAASSNTLRQVSTDDVEGTRRPAVVAQADKMDVDGEDGADRDRLTTPRPVKGQKRFPKDKDRRTTSSLSDLDSDDGDKPVVLGGNGKETKQKPVKKQSVSARSDSEDESSTSSSDDLPPSANAIRKTFAQISDENLVLAGSKRGAAAKAAALLADAIRDRNAYEKELKSSGRKGGAAGHAGAGGVGSSAARRRSRSPRKPLEECEAPTSDGDEGDEPETVVKKGKAAATAKGAKRGAKALKAEEADDADELSLEQPQKKKAKTAAAAPKGKVKAVQASATTQEGAVSSFDRPPNAKPPVPVQQKVKILSTGLGLDKASPEIRSLKAFGANWTEQPKDATHLVVKGISRTEKFLCSLPFAPKIVTKAWIDACVAAGRLVDEMPYLLRDTKKEAEIGDKLEAILARARAGKLFAGRNVYVTRQVIPDANTIQRILSASGAVVQIKDLTKVVKKIADDEDALVISSPADRREWEKLAAAPHRREIYGVEAVFLAVLHQDLARGFTPANRVDPQLHG
ncbi:uncharacterized protein JCM10292_007290 [Rhodotorula paludigena]|uniref:uncharacterized protein n=1 Tax=Rhodotorula paludigena TaxID=86838 RepID=UPI00318134B6